MKTVETTNWRYFSVREKKRHLFNKKRIDTKRFAGKRSPAEVTRSIFLDQQRGDEIQNLATRLETTHIFVASATPLLPR